MNYGYIEKNKIIAPVAMRSRFNNVGAWNLLTDEQRAQYGWYPCDVINEGYDAVRQIRSTFPECVFDPETQRITATYTIVDKPLDAVKIDHKRRMTQARYECEVGGTEFDNGWIDTDRDTQNRINQAVTLTQINPDMAEVNWKQSDGTWVKLPVVVIVAMGKAIGQHVQHCFTRENELHDFIDACTNIDDVLKIQWTYLGQYPT